MPVSFTFNKNTSSGNTERLMSCLCFTEKIKVNLDRSQVPIKAILLETKSEVYVAPPRKSEAILSRIELPPDADEATLKAAASPNSSTQFGKEIRKCCNQKHGRAILLCRIELFP